MYEPFSTNWHANVGFMSTLVCFHAHPDDEAINTAGVMSMAASTGHRVVLVVATRGELGTPQEGILAPDEELWARRVEETHQSAALLGVQRVEFLGYTDSGMMGAESNNDPTCFWQASVDEAALRLASILTEEGASVLTIYDENGGYGHPDHIMVHRVGKRAAELAMVDRVFEATMNRDHIKSLMNEHVDDLEELPESPDPSFLDSLGSPESAITHRIDVSEFIQSKRDSLRAHASQIGDNSFFLQMPDEHFLASFGIEWFIRTNHPRGVDEPFGTNLWDD